jgi:hypothetical protein
MIWYSESFLGCNPGTRRKIIGREDRELKPKSIAIHPTGQRKKLKIHKVGSCEFLKEVFGVERISM